MRQAADILSSAPAMQIRYLEAMQAMAKSANSKVIFLPAANQTMPGGPGFNAQLADAAKNKYGEDEAHDTGSGSAGFDQAVRSHIIENI